MVLVDHAILSCTLSPNWLAAHQAYNFRWQIPFQSALFNTNFLNTCYLQQLWIDFNMQINTGNRALQGRITLNLDRFLSTYIHLPSAIIYMMVNGQSMQCTLCQNPYGSCFVHNFCKPPEALGIQCNNFSYYFCFNFGHDILGHSTIRFSYLLKEENGKTRDNAGNRFTCHKDVDDYRQTTNQKVA